MHLKVLLKLKNPENCLFWTYIQKNKKTQKTPKNQKTQKNHWAGVFYRIFSNPAHRRPEPGGERAKPSCRGGGREDWGGGDGGRYGNGRYEEGDEKFVARVGGQKTGKGARRTRHNCPDQVINNILCECTGNWWIRCLLAKDVDQNLCRINT